MQELFHSHLSNAWLISPGFSPIVPSISRTPGSILNVLNNKNENMCTPSVNYVPENVGALGNFLRLLSTCAVKDRLLPYVFDYAHATGLLDFTFVGPSTAAQKKACSKVNVVSNDPCIKASELNFSSLCMCCSLFLLSAPNSLVFWNIVHAFPNIPERQLGLI